MFCGFSARLLHNVDPIEVVGVDERTEYFMLQTMHKYTSTWLGVRLEIDASLRVFGAN